jgi:protein ImuA
LTGTKADILARLQKEILPLNGFKPVSGSNDLDVGLGTINYAFPSANFPLGAIHEFICAGKEDAAATGGFIAGIVSTLMQKGGVCLWISTTRKLFPPSLRQFAIEPDKVIFITVKKENEVLWVLEEALKCEGLSAVVGEIKELNFTVSRRLQLAVEQSKVTGFVIRHNQKQLNTTASIARWKIQSLRSSLPADMPGVGFPRWKVELLKARNGKPGTWDIEWVDGNFKHRDQASSIQLVKQRKTG